MPRVQNTELHNESFKRDYELFQVRLSTHSTRSWKKIFMLNLRVDTKPKLLSFRILFLYLNKNTSEYHNSMQLNWKSSWWNSHLYVCPFQELNGLSHVYIVFQRNRV